MIGSDFKTQWKGSDGVFFLLDQSGTLAMATAVLGYINACYATEATTLAAIAAGTISTTAQIDDAAWPSNVAS